MLKRSAPRVLVVAFLCVAGAAVGCRDTRSPLASTDAPGSPLIHTLPPSGEPIVEFVNPSKAATVAPAALITITGKQFQTPLTVTFGETPAVVLEATERSITAMAPIHGAGPVDIVVINPDGQSGRLVGRFAYEVAPAGLPRIQSVAPNHGVVTGDTPVEIVGTGFSFATAARLGGVPMRSYITSTGSLMVTASAHAAGVVDITVVNPDGQATLPEAFTYVAAENLDINGTWVGRAGDHWDVPLIFTIEHNVLVNLSCNGAAARALSVPLSWRNGRHSFVQDGVVLMDGGFRSSQYGTGSINLAPCSIHWEACSESATSPHPWCWKR